MATHLLPRTLSVHARCPLRVGTVWSPGVPSAPGSQGPEGQGLFSTPGLAFFLKHELFSFVEMGTKATGNLAWAYPIKQGAAKDGRCSKHSRSCCISSLAWCKARVSLWAQGAPGSGRHGVALLSSGKSMSGTHLAWQRSGLTPPSSLTRWARALPRRPRNQRREKMDRAASRLGSGMLLSFVLWSVHGGALLRKQSGSPGDNKEPVSALAHTLS